MRGKHKSYVIEKIIDKIHSETISEETVHLLLSEKLSEPEKQQDTFGMKMADSIAGFVGSWLFICCFCAILIVWMLLNTLVTSFDVYPFILLNLLLSCIAALQAPLIMMSQNKAEQKDRARAENDYKINLKSEIIVENIHFKLDELAKEQQILLQLLQKKSFSEIDEKFSEIDFLQE